MLPVVMSLDSSMARDESPSAELPPLINVRKAKPMDWGKELK